MADEDWSPCPRCGSNRVQKVYKWAIVISLLAAAGCFVWIGLFFPLLWIAIPILVVLSFISIFGKDSWQCQDCKKMWEVKGKPLTVGALIKYTAAGLFILVLCYGCSK